MSEPAHSEFDETLLLAQVTEKAEFTKVTIYFMAQEDLKDA